MLPSMKGLRFYHLQANRSTCHHFIDTGSGHETPVTEMKDSLLFMAIVVARIPEIFHQFSKPQIPQGSTKRGRCQLHIQWFVLQERNPKLKEYQSFIMGS